MILQEHSCEDQSSLSARGPALPVQGGFALSAYQRAIAHPQRDSGTHIISKSVKVLSLVTVVALLLESKADS